MRQWRVTGTSALLVAAGLLATTACGAVEGSHDVAREASEQGVVEVAAALGADGPALAAMGFEVTDIDGGSGERAERWRERRQARVLLRRNTLHGEVVVEAPDATLTVTVQRGTVTAIGADSMTVKSTDGFTMTWRFHTDLRVVQRRTTIQPADVAVGAEVGVAGAGADGGGVDGAGVDGDGGGVDGAGVARLVVLPSSG